MAKKKLTNEERQIDLLEKLLIIELYINGVGQDQIRKILNISPNKVNEVAKYLNKKKSK